MGFYTIVAAGMAAFKQRLEAFFPTSNEQPLSRQDAASIVAKRTQHPATFVSREFGPPGNGLR